MDEVPVLLHLDAKCTCRRTNPKPVVDCELYCVALYGLRQFTTLVQMKDGDNWMIHDGTKKPKLNYDNQTDIVIQTT